MYRLLIPLTTVSRPATAIQVICFIKGIPRRAPDQTTTYDEFEVALTGRIVIARITLN